MRISLSGVTARVERLTAQCHTEAAATNLDNLLEVLDRGRTNPRPRKMMTPAEYAAWSERLRASVRGTNQAKLAERLIAGRQRVDTARREHGLCGGGEAMKPESKSS